MIRIWPLGLLALGILSILAPVPAGCTAGAAAAKSGTASVAQPALYYEQSGRGPAVVLIHGGQMDRRMWDDQFEDLPAISGLSAMMFAVTGNRPLRPNVTLISRTC